ncbi:endo-1,4-beta-xylanase [Microvirga terrestris]|uniref:Beta-xylanase n=1 Tax=Microvirga terrestris TaxID=2791024 RepID=A0ABS0HXE9_9HYPH|nr:endo-1,4-beta-xylanase [Microvirga terrestris]MBF9197840.1 endo-1,4-beta-xylanase [Microvirga terrestris]
MHHEPKKSSLSSAAARNGMLFGTALCTSDLLSQPVVRTVLRDCSIVTPEYELKWDSVSGTQDKLDYTGADKLIAFASDNDLAVHGHTLWWHEAIPSCFQKSSDKQFRAAALKHLTGTVNRYAGQLHSWDVVNEPLEPDHGRRDGLRETRFLTAFGPDYIEIAFREAARLDPKAVLVLNEMGLEYGSPAAERKRRQMLALLEREKARGTPIACLGIQSHLTALEQPREHPDFRCFLREVRAMGLSVMITEMDVSDHLCPRDRRRRDAIVTDTYRAYLDLVLEEAEVLAVITWGLSDGRTWLNSFRPRPDGAPHRPLLFDRAVRRKHAWHGVRDSLLNGRQTGSRASGLSIGTD